MTPEQFWYDDPDLFWSYWDAYEMRKKEEAQEQNIYSYNLAHYIFLAVQECLQFSKNPKKIFPREPFKLGFDKEKKQMTNEEYQEMRKVQMMQMVNMFNSKK